MAKAEFDLIRRYFACHKPVNSNVELGIGDDCALFNLPVGQQLAVTTDTMVEGVHFLANVDPEALGHKLLAVNLSDLAAMGAKPFAVTLSLSIPRIDHSWLEAFARGFMQLARTYAVDLVGGDTTSGPLTLTVQAMGFVPQSQALLRSAAQPGDLIYLSGQIGDAGLGLKIRLNQYPYHESTALQALERPLPQVTTGLALRGVARACIDVSDGLLADLGHIMERSGVGARLEWDDLPLSSAVKRYLEVTGDWQMPLIAGDDYQLCFTVAPDQQHLVPEYCVKIGQIEAELGLRVYKSGDLQTIQGTGYEHFA